MSGFSGPLGLCGKRACHSLVTRHNDCVNLPPSAVSDLQAYAKSAWLITRLKQFGINADSMQSTLSALGGYTSLGPHKSSTTSGPTGRVSRFGSYPPAIRRSRANLRWILGVSLPSSRSAITLPMTGRNCQRERERGKT